MTALAAAGPRATTEQHSRRRPETDEAHTAAGPRATTEQHEPPPGRVLVIGCGALARELREVSALNGGAHITVECLPAKLHNRPEQIAPAVRGRVRAAKAAGVHRTILVGYMDCGTGGALDRVCAEEGVQRLPGDHCYELYAGAGVFAALHDAEPGTFYLTDYLVRHFDRLIMRGLGIAEHPQLLEIYFGNYTRVVHLAQADDPSLAQAAEQAAARLGLRCERILTGIDGLRHQVVSLARSQQPRPATDQPLETPTATDQPLKTPTATAPPPATDQPLKTPTAAAPPPATDQPLETPTATTHPSTAEPPKPPAAPPATPAERRAARLVGAGTA